MPTLHQYDYLFAIGTIFCTLDAFMIGANDVANSFATSVSSKSLTLRQACIAAAIFEFLGAVTVGARTASTIKNGIVPPSVFEGNPALQLLTFVNAIFVSSVWLSIATYFSWPVSTTYSIISAVAGSGIAVGGFNAPRWGWNNANGLAAIWAGLFIAPALAASFAAIVYLLVKFIVLKNKNPTRAALYTGPVWFFLVAAVCTMSIIYKGSPTLNLKAMSKAKTAAAIILTALVIAILSVLFWIPYVHAKVVKKDHTIRFYHFFMGPLLFKRPAPEDAGSKAYVPDYRVRETREGDVVSDSLHLHPSSNLAKTLATQTHQNVNPDAGRHDVKPAAAAGSGSISASAAEEEKIYGHSDDIISSNTRHTGVGSGIAEVATALPSALEDQVERPSATARPTASTFLVRLARRAWSILTHGSSVDIHALQRGQANTPEGRRMQAIYDRAVQYPNETEHLFSFLQVMTACTASFAHGANDLSNAIGPFSVIYYTWKTGQLAGKSVPVQVWYLVYGAAALVLGLWTYGYNIMAVLGNRITLHSPSRGFTMELGAAITVILASQYGIPVSTTMCITGATIGTSLCSGDIRSTNWRAIGWIYLGWIFTIVMVMILSACSLGIIVNAPRK